MFANLPHLEQMMNMLDVLLCLDVPLTACQGSPGGTHLSSLVSVSQLEVKVAFHKYTENQ